MHASAAFGMLLTEGLHMACKHVSTLLLHALEAYGMVQHVLSTCSQAGVAAISSAKNGRRLRHATAAWLAWMCGVRGGTGV